MTSPPDPTPTNGESTPATRGNRRTLLVLAVLIFGTFAVAATLRLSGWRPEGMKNKGELLQPPTDVRDLQLKLANGTSYAWLPAERRWRIVVAPPANCTAECDQLAQQLDTAWQVLGRQRDHVDVLWVGHAPASAPASSNQRGIGPTDVLRARLPRADDAKGAVVYVLDPNGFVVLRYAPGFDPGDLRTDLARLLKLA